jgi:hypothetical protein
MAARKASASPRTGKLKFDASAIGSSGLRQWGGIVDEEFLKELRGTKGAAVYREMSDNDPTVGAIIFAISMLLRQAKWDFKAADDSAEAEDAKSFCEDVFKKMKRPIEDVMDEVCTMFAYGYAPMEIVWSRRDDGNIGIASISLRNQITVAKWEMDEGDGSIDGLWQQPWSGPQVFIPIEKMLLFRTSVAKNNPEGRSLLRNAYRPWKMKKRIEDIEGVGVERDLAGLPVAKIPGRFFSADADNDDKAVLASYKSLVRNVRNDRQQGVVLPSDTDSKGNALYTFELLGSAGSRAIDTSKIVDRYDRQIATSVLADFIFLGQQSVGSFALSSDKTALFANAVGGFLKAIAAVFNRHLWPRCWELNAFDPDMMPEQVPGDMETQDLTELAGYITSLAGAGMALFPDPELEGHLREEAGLPPAPEDSYDAEATPIPTAGPNAAIAVAAHAATLPPPPEAVGGAGPGAQGKKTEKGRRRRPRA